MDIEQAIYTYVKVSYDTRTTGFGFYSMTKGMELLLAKSRELRALTSSYTAPRDTPSAEENDPAAEEKWAAEHHPIAFGYTFIKAGAKRLAVMTYGKDLGRDLGAIPQPGNFLLNTVVFDLEKLNGCPYEYYGSREVFYDIDRSFFADADDEPAPMLKKPAALTFGRTAPSVGEVCGFVSSGGRSAQFISMLGAVMDIADGAGVKRLIVCDAKENMIKWIAALSIVYPAAIAAELTFKTYSFLGNSREGTVPIYDDVIFCGVYTPTVNGDAAFGNATNYDFSSEWVKRGSAVVDTEQNSAYKPKSRQTYFTDLVKECIGTGDIFPLERYREFITDKTSCRTLGHDYARGFAYYNICVLKNKEGMRNIADAMAFAKKYMDENAVMELLAFAYGCMDGCGCDCGADDVFFGPLAEITRESVKEGVITNSYAADKYMKRLMKCFRSNEIVHEDYRAKKNVAAEFLNKSGSSFDRAFVETMTTNGIMKLISAPCKHWKLKETAACLGGLMAEHYTEELGNLFSALGIRLISAEKTDRQELIASLMRRLKDDIGKAVFLEEMYRVFTDEASVRADLAGCMAELYTELDDVTLCGTLGAGELYRMLEKSCAGANGARGLTLIYAVFLLSRENGGLSEERLTELIDDYFNIAADLYGLYRFGETAGERLLEMIASADDPTGMMIGELANAAAVFYIVHYAEETDESRMVFEPETLRYLCFEGADNEEMDECGEIVGKAFARRSIKLGKAVDVRFDVFIDCEDPENDRVVARLFMVWMREIAASGERRSAALFAQVLAMAASVHRLDGGAIGTILAESDIAPSEIESYLQSDTVMNYLNETGSWDSALRAYFNGLMHRIEEAYTEIRPKKGFGMFKRSGKKKK